MPPSFSGLGEPSKDEAKLHRTVTRAAWVADPGAPTERAVFDPDAGSDKPPQLYPVWSTTGAELGQIGGEGLRLYFLLIKGLAILLLAMATIMCGPLVLNANGEMYKLSASSHFSDLYTLATVPVTFPGTTPPGDRQAWRSLRAGTTLGTITRSRSTVLPPIGLIGGRKKCWGAGPLDSSQTADQLCDCIPGFVPRADDVGDLFASCAKQPSDPLCSSVSTQQCAASGRRLDELSADDATDQAGDAGDDGCQGNFCCGARHCGASAVKVAPNCDCQEHGVQASAYSGGGLKSGSKCMDMVDATERTLLLYSAFDVVSIICFVVGSVLLQRRMAAAGAETNAAGFTMSDYSVLLEPPDNWSLGNEQTPASPAEFIRRLEDHLADCKWPVATQKDGSSCIWPVYADSQHISHWGKKVKSIYGLVEELAAVTQASNEEGAEQAEYPKVEKALDKLRKLNAKAKEKNAKDRSNGVVEAVIVSLRSEADRIRATEQTIIDFCGQRCISVLQAPEPSALNFGNFELPPAKRAMRARLSVLLQVAILGVVMFLLQTLYSSVPALQLPCDQMKFSGGGGTSLGGGRVTEWANLGSHRKAWAENPVYCTRAECEFMGGSFIQEDGGHCIKDLDASKKGVCDGATVDTLTFGADNKGYMASAAAEFYRLRWQLVKAAQSISAYPSLETEGHNLPVCDESEFSTTLPVVGKPSLVKSDIPWAQASSKGCHRKYDEEYPRFSSAIRLPIGSSLDASCYHCICECYTSGKEMIPDVTTAGPDGKAKGVVMAWPTCPTMGGSTPAPAQGGSAADPSIAANAAKSDEFMMSYPEGAEARGMSKGYCDEYVEWKAGVSRRKSISSLAVTVVNQLAAVGWKQLIKFEKRVSLGKHYASLAQKVFVFQFLNTVGLTVLLNSQFVHAGLPVVGDGKWYYTVGADLIQVMMMNVVVPPTVHVVKFVVQRALQSLAKARTQVVLNKKFEPPAWDFAASLGEVLFISWTTLTLSTGMPIMLWIGAFGLGLKYWVDKWAVLRAYAKPPMYGTDVFDNLPTHLYLMAALHLIVACYFLKVSGGVTPESLKGSLNLISPVKAVPLVAGGVTSAEGAWQGGYGQAHVLLPLLLLVCLVAAGVGQTVRAFAKQRSSSHKTKVIEVDAGTEVSVVPPAAAAVADENGGGGTAPEFAVALSQGLIINSHDNYEIQGQVELSVLQEELHAMFASDETLTIKFGEETVKSILVEVGDRASEDAMHFGGGGKTIPPEEGA